MRIITISPFLLIILFIVSGCLEYYDPIFLGHPVTGTFIDSRDGKEYTWTKIGQQTWMAENLAYLPAVTPVSVGSDKDNCYYVYDYDGSDLNEAKSNKNFFSFGVYYNASAAATACPVGWHLPNQADWETLAEKVLGYQLLFEFNKWNQSGRFLKAEGNLTDGTGLWNNYSFSATPDTFRFSALPAGYRDKSGVSMEWGERAYWWEEKIQTEKYPRYWYLDNGDVLNRNKLQLFTSNNILANGYSIRCLKINGN
jgi:uncharacterized protein (TIGR02145 family)